MSISVYHAYFGKEFPRNAGNWSSIPGEGNGNPFQYSCLEISMDREVWWVTIHWVARVGHDWVTNITHTHTHTRTYTHNGRDEDIWLSFIVEHKLLNTWAIFHNSLHHLVPRIWQCSINTRWPCWLISHPGQNPEHYQGGALLEVWQWGGPAHMFPVTVLALRQGHKQIPQLSPGLANSGTISHLCFHFSCESSFIDLINSLFHLWHWEVILSTL